MTYRHFNNESTRSSVLRAVANTENEAAWQRLFDLYAGFVFSIARSKGLKPEDADDIVQVVFTDLARNLPTFQYDRSKGRFRSYLAVDGMKVRVEGLRKVSFKVKSGFHRITNAAKRLRHRQNQNI